MPDFGSLLHFAKFLTALTVEEEYHRKHAMEEACKIVEKRAKEVIGTYDSDPTWKELAESTQEDRSRKGYAPNDPLLRNGDLQNSIKHNVMLGPRSGHALSYAQGRIGSASQIAVYQELGTKRIPPRSFLRASAVEKEHEIKKLIGDGLVAGLIRNK